MVRRTLLVAGLLGVACAADDNNNSPFGVATRASATATATATATDSGSSGSGSSTGDEETGTPGTTSGTSTGALTTAPGSTSTSTASTGAEETTATEPGTQPADGLYSPCLVAQDCDPIPALCITINDADGNPTDGFCSQTGCLNPAVDCVPTPGGTALPACMPVTVDGGPESACALDCSGGATCPSPMTCYSLDFGMICG